MAKNFFIFVSLVATFTSRVNCNGRGSFAGSRPINSGDLNVDTVNNRFGGTTELYFDRPTRVYSDPRPNDHVGFGDQGAVDSVNTLGGSSQNQNTFGGFGQNQNTFGSGLSQNNRPFQPQPQYTTAQPSYYVAPTTTYQKTGYGYGSYNNNNNNKGYGAQNNRGYGSYNKNNNNYNRGQSGSYGGGYGGYTNRQNWVQNQYGNRKQYYAHQNKYNFAPYNRYPNTFSRNQFDDESDDDDSKIDIRMNSKSDHADENTNDKVVFNP